LTRERRQKPVTAKKKNRPQKGTTNLRIRNTKTDERKLRRGKRSPFSSLKEPRFELPRASGKVYTKHVQGFLERKRKATREKRKQPQAEARRKRLRRSTGN